MKRVLVSLIVLMGSIEALTVDDIFSVIGSHEFTEAQKLAILRAYKRTRLIPMDRKSPTAWSPSPRFSPLGYIFLKKTELQADPRFGKFDNGKAYNERFREYDALYRALERGGDLGVPAIGQITIAQAIAVLNGVLTLEQLEEILDQLGPKVAQSNESTK